MNSDIYDYFGKCVGRGGCSDEGRVSCSSKHWCISLLIKEVMECLFESIGYLFYDLISFIYKKN